MTKLLRRIRLERILVLGGLVFLPAWAGVSVPAASTTPTGGSYRMVIDGAGVGWLGGLTGTGLVQAQI